MTFREKLEERMTKAGAHLGGYWSFEGNAFVAGAAAALDVLWDELPDLDFERFGINNSDVPRVALRRWLLSLAREITLSENEKERP